jgi:hypothetical protein
MIAIVTGVRRNLSGDVLICISFVAEHVEPFFMDLLAILTSFEVVQFIYSFSWMIYCFGILFLSTLDILEYSAFLVRCY